MPLKKKTAVAKNIGKSDPEPAFKIEGPARRRLANAAQEAAASAGPAEARSVAQAQLKAFEHAVRLFHSGKFAEARESFAKAASGPNREMGHNAELHIRMCDRRLQKPVVDLKTADDHYNYGVAMINARNLTAAREHLEEALTLEPGADHVFYALALCKGLAGDIEGASESLKRAIDLEPRNRITARQDADFSGFSSHPQIQQLLSPDKTGAA
jgi:tetratricopeptide (TPR) repeat protein